MMIYAIFNGNVYLGISLGKYITHQEIGTMKSWLQTLCDPRCRQSTAQVKAVIYPAQVKDVLHIHICTIELYSRKISAALLSSISEQPSVAIHKAALKTRGTPAES